MKLKSTRLGQMLTAGAATYAIQLAGNALGFESFWATGPLVEGT